MSPSIWSGDWICVDKIGYGGEYHLLGRELSLPKFRSVHRGDIMVFHFPEGDTVFPAKPKLNYYEVLKCGKEGDGFFKTVNYGNRVFLPISYRIPYVKRCVGLPGETIKIVNYKVYINGKPLKDNLDKRMIYNVFYQDRNETSSLNTLPRFLSKCGENCGVFSLSDKEKQLLQTVGEVDSIRLSKSYRVSNYYFSKELFEEKKWDVINYGPIEIPQKGKKLSINTSNISIYRRLIETYEGNRLEVRQDSLMINGITTDYYIPTQDYYFMMGDNRTASIDSRNWGFVPEDHLIGRVFTIGWSRDLEVGGLTGIRWGRIFKNLIKYQQ